jgi:hypothetical protein
MSKIQEYAKLLAALIGTAVTAGTSVIAPDDLEWLSFIGAIITTFAVYRIPNTVAADGRHEAENV